MRLNLSRILFRLIGLTVASVVLFLMMGVASALAAPIIVNTLLDTNDTGVDCENMVIGDLPGTDTKVSLREAICVTNNDGIGKAIGFGVTGTITFTSTTPQIDEDTWLIIDGGGNIVLDGNSAARSCFGTDLEESTVTTVTLKGLTFQNFGGASLCVSGTDWVVGGTNVADRNFFLGTIDDSGAAMQVYGNGHTIRNNYVGVESDGTTKNSMYDGIVLHNDSTSTTLRDNIITSGGGCGIKFWDRMGSTVIAGNQIGVGLSNTDLNPTTGICDNESGTYSGVVTIGAGDEVTRNIISGATGNGIELLGPYSAGVLIQGNYIGTNLTGDAALENVNGIVARMTCSSTPCVIGGTAEGKRNVISGNTASGIRFADGSSNIEIKNNYIGLNAAGDAALANEVDGILVTGTATNLTIGDETYRNTISGNTGRGIRANDAAGLMTISGNNIGTNPAGIAAIANGSDGLGVNGSSPSITIGDLVASAPTNIISGNSGRGIRIQNTTGGLVKVYSSIIGLNADQSAAVPNVKQGVLIDGTSNASTITIGNLLTNGFNVIAGNSSDETILNGIRVDDGSSATFRGNHIGVNSAGTTVFGNGGDGNDGMYILGDNVVIGGTVASNGNVIAGHSGTKGEEAVAQILIGSTAADTTIFGNFIGVSTDGSSLGASNNVGVYDTGTDTIIGSGTGTGRNHFGNLVKAIGIDGSAGARMQNNYIGIKPDGTASDGALAEGIVVTGTATGTVIGGSGDLVRNVIGNVTDSGIVVNGVTGIDILGNYIGLAPDGTSDFGNAQHGIQVVNVTNLYIGRNAADTIHEGNFISGNAGSGINLASAGTISGVYIEANKIGTNAAIDGAVGNTVDGITITAGSGIVIGGTDAASRNIISGNGEDGVDLYGVDGVAIQGNYIGHGGTLGVDVGNVATGIHIREGASSNTIGFSYSGEIDSTRANYINFNGGNGIRLSGAETDLNTIRGNIVGTSNTLGEFSFVSEANSGNSLANTYLDNATDALIDGRTNLGGKIDFYKITAGNVVTYEGTSVIREDGGFFLLKPFVVTDGDRYFVQITTGAGNSTGYGVYKFVAYDSTLPSRPLINSPTGVQNSTPYTFVGRKDEYTSIWANDVEVVEADGETTFTFDAALIEGVNTFNITSKDEAGNTSSVAIKNVVLDTVAPVAPTVNGATVITGVAENPWYRYEGTKEVGTSIWIGGVRVILASSATNWVYDVTLVEGANTFSFTSKDLAGNQSPAVEHTIQYERLDVYGGGDGGGSPLSWSTVEADTVEADTVEADTVESDTVESDTVEADTVEAVVSPPIPQITAHGPPGVLPPPIRPPINPAVAQQLIENAQNNHPVYNPNISSDLPVVRPPQSPGDGDRIGANVPPLVVALPQNLHQAAEQAPPKFQNLLTIVANTDSSNTVVDVSESASETVTAPTTDIVASPAPALNISSLVDTTNIIIPSGFVRNDNGIIIPSGVVASEPQIDVLPIIGNPPAVAPPPPNRLEIITNSTTYAELTPTTDDGIPVHLADEITDISADSDGDGMSDGLEILVGSDPLSEDTDNDGISDAIEAAAGLDVANSDSDRDGISDAEEIELGLNPLSSDSDGDGSPDAVELSLADGDASAAIDATVSAADDDNDGLPDFLEVKYNVGGGSIHMLSNGEEVVIPPVMMDSDNDGVPDVNELKMGTDPTKSDSDGDGFTDAEEIKIFGTDPNTVTEIKQAYEPRVAIQTQQPVFTYNNPSVLGVAPPNTPVSVFFILKAEDEVDSQIGWSLNNLSQFLMVNLFAEKKEDYYQVDTVTDAGGKFLAKAELPDGDFDVIVRTYDADGEIADEGMPFELSVDTSIEADGTVTPHQLDDEKIDVNSLQLITLGNNRPVLYGKATRDYQVEVMWASELFSSSLMIDTDEDEGEFVVMAPSELEDGEHDVVIQGIDPMQNLYTAAINVDFMVMSGGIYELDVDDPMDRMKVIGFGFGGVLVIAVLWLIARGRKRQFED